MGRSQLQVMTKRTDEQRSEHNAYMKEWRQRNRDDQNAKARERYRREREDPEKIAKHNEYQRDYRKKNRERITHNAFVRALKREYDLSWEEYQALVGEGCEICGSHHLMRVDHCHTSDVVRGGLCHACNTGIGFLGDSPDRLRAAAEYLDKHMRYLKSGTDEMEDWLGG